MSYVVQIHYVSEIFIQTELIWKKVVLMTKIQHQYVFSVWLIHRLFSTEETGPALATVQHMHEHHQGESEFMNGQ